VSSESLRAMALALAVSMLAAAWVRPRWRRTSCRDRVDLAAARKPHFGDVAAQDRDAAGKAAVAQFEKQARRRQLGQRGQALDDVRLERLDDALAGWLIGLRAVLERPPHRRVVDAKAPGHGLDGQLLGQHQPAHVHAHFRRDH
jgi:hypothetical protein